MTDWSRGNCRTPHGLTVEMVPETSAETARAIRLCGGCPIIADCEREFANEDHGVFFGTSARERHARRHRYGRKPTPRGNQ